MKRCPFCAEEIQEAAIKCRHCGSMLNTAPPVATTASTAAPSSTPSSAPQSPSALSGPEAPVVEIYTGAPSWKGRFWRYIAVAGLLTAAITSVLVNVYTDVEGAWTFVGAGLLSLVALMLGGRTELERRATRYRITSRAIDVETGVFARKISSVQLWRVREVTFEQSASERVLGIGTVRFVTHDEHLPLVLMVALPDGRGVFEKAKVAIDEARRGNVMGLVQ